MYIGSSPLIGTYEKLDDISSSFNGVTTEFNCEVDGVDSIIGSPNNLIVAKNGLLLDPGVDYNIGSSGHSIVFSVAPLITDNINIRVLGHVFNLPSAANNTITTSKIVNNAITTDKIIDNSITLNKLTANSVNGSKIVDNSITLDKLTANSVNGSKIVDRSVSDSKQNSGTSSEGHILMADGSGGATYENFSSFWAYDSGLFAVVPAVGKYNMAHGLSYTPTDIIVELVCISADQGYSVGDIIRMDLSTPLRERSNLPASTLHYGYMVGANSTDVFIVSGSTGRYTVMNASTGAWNELVMVKWNMRVRAR